MSSVKKKKKKRGIKDIPIINIESYNINNVPSADDTILISENATDLQHTKDIVGLSTNIRIIETMGI